MGAPWALLGVALVGCAPEVGVDDLGGASQAARSESATGAAIAERVTVVVGAPGADGLQSYWLFARGSGCVVRARSPQAALSKWREEHAEEEKADRAAPTPPAAVTDSKQFAIPIGPGGRTDP